MSMNYPNEWIQWGLIVLMFGSVLVIIGIVLDVVSTWYAP